MKLALQIPAVVLITMMTLSTASLGDSDKEPENIPAAEGYQEVVDSLQKAIRFQIEQKEIPAFSIALVDGDRVVWAEGFGYCDAQQSRPTSARSVYRVGSVSKLFTDIAVMRLVEEGKVSLDAPITEALPDFTPRNPFDTPLTLRQLMSHLSGLVREPPVGSYFDLTEPSLAETVASLNDTTIVYRPNTRRKYSNAAVSVVGYVLSRMRGKSFPAAIEDEILRPLDMNDSGFALTPALKQLLADGRMWTYDGRRFVAPQFKLGTDPAGNLYASVLDLTHFIRMVLDDGRWNGKQVVKSETLRQMTTAPKDADKDAESLFGIGFHIEDLDGHRKIGHGGAVYGYSTQVEILPDQRLGVAAVSALDGSNGLVDRIASYALRLMLAHREGKPLPKFELAAPVFPERAAQVVGVYRKVDKATDAGPGAAADSASNKTTDKPSSAATARVLSEVIDKPDNQTIEITQDNKRLYIRWDDFRRELRLPVDTLFSSRAPVRDMVIDDVRGLGPRVEIPEIGELVIEGRRYKRLADEPPADAPERWKGLIGEYGWDHNTLYILEEHGRLIALIEWFYYYPLTEISENEFAFPNRGMYHGEKLIFTRDDDGNATQVVAAGVLFKRREVGTKDGETFKIKPVKPIDQLRGEALKAQPPKETGDFRQANYAQLNKLDPTIRLDIRYATTNNFTGGVFYKQPRAFMQHPAAEAVVRAHRKLEPRGLGLMIHDAYRPWFVTKMFWDATPEDLKDFVANPQKGSRHNRGCAVDLTLYDRQTGEPITMVAGYDEFSQRSYPKYPGGTSRKRWYRDLLRRTMESEGFTIYDYEWWHFDYKDWKKYRIGKLTFEEILRQKGKSESGTKSDE